MTVHKEPEFPHSLRHLSPEYEAFFQLVRPKTEKKSRPCLKCNKNHVTGTAGERICGQCASVNSRVGALATYSVDSIVEVER